jgi:hypothetical protein
MRKNRENYDIRGFVLGREQRDAADLLSRCSVFAKATPDRRAASEGAAIFVRRLPRAARSQIRACPGLLSAALSGLQLAAFAGGIARPHPQERENGRQMV